jgi:hypothetical protein
MGCVDLIVSGFRELCYTRSFVKIRLFCYFVYPLDTPKDTVHLCGLYMPSVWQRFLLHVCVA